MNLDNIRRKRVGKEGEWEYECAKCDLWLPVEKFRGCKTYTDPYGNCLMCSSCRAKATRQTLKVNEEIQVKQLLKIIGFYNYKNSEEWFKAKMEKHPTKKTKR
jgi:hypothetical protein